MKKTHVQQWREADDLSRENSFRATQGYEMLNQLKDKWLGTQWTTLLNGKKIVGTLRTIDESKFVDGHNIDPAFTLELEDTNGYPMTITRHFEQFAPVK